MKSGNAPYRPITRHSAEGLTEQSYVLARLMGANTVLTLKDWKYSNRFWGDYWDGREGHVTWEQRIYLCSSTAYSSFNASLYLDISRLSITINELPAPLNSCTWKRSQFSADRSRVRLRRKCMPLSAKFTLQHGLFSSSSRGPLTCSA
jgi:hypothetical protein